MISIILPFRNTEDFIKDCIESIIIQSETEWELISVNDHSADLSKDIMLEYSKKDSRIQVIENGSEGIVEALKTGFANSKGEFIHRMDSDDIMPEHKLSILKSLLKKSGRGHLATGKVKYFSGKPISKGYRVYENWLNYLSNENRHWDEIYKECVIASPAWMIQRDDFESCGAFNSDSYPEDYDLAFRLYENRFKIISTNKLIHLWREHSKRSSRNSQNYQQKAFYLLKTKYWLKLEKDPLKSVALIGAGVKNKLMIGIFKNLRIDHISFNDPERLSKAHITNWFKGLIQSKAQAQFIITIADEKVKNEIRITMKEFKFRENEDFYFFS